MIDYINEMYQDLARDLRRCCELYPSKSQEYKIMMQDLSRGNPRTIVPDIEFTDESIVQLRDILYTMPSEYLRFFFFYYIKRYGRDRKMQELGFTSKQEYYGMRDKLHSYTQGRLDGVDQLWGKPRVRTITPSKTGSSSMVKIAVPECGVT